MTDDELLAALAGAAGIGALLWRGDDEGARDVDLLVREEVAGAVTAVLSAAGLSPRAEPGGRTVWTDRAGRLLPVDVLPAERWQPFYPTLDSVFSRAAAGRGGLAVASPEDRLLMLAGEAVAGRPIEKIVRKATALIAQPGVPARVAAVGTAQGAADLAALISRPADLEALARDGRLPYGEALRLAAHSPRARAALRVRLGERARAAAAGDAKLPRTADLLADLRGRPRPASGPGRILAFSGMDGSGKSTLADTVRRQLETVGRPVELAWVRVASEAQVLDRVSGPVKLLLHREGSTADPVAAAAPGAAPPAAAPPADGRRDLVAWTWVLVVALVTARGLRRASRRRRAGATIVADRWLTDALVDLEVRYGRHRAAERLLLALTPRADLALLLTVDAVTAAERKPGDQAPIVLERMERLYAEKGARAGATVLDGRRPPADIAEQALALVAELG